MIRNEAGKLIRNPYLLGLFIVCIILNTFILLYGNMDGYPAGKYRGLWNDFLSGDQNLSHEIELIEDRVQKTRDSEMRTQEELYTRFLQELKGIESYGEYRQSILDNAKKMMLFSSFSQDNFAKKNVEKTAEHFKEMKPVEVVAAPSLGVEKVFSPITAVLELVFLMYLGYLLFIKENENGIQKLLYVTRYGKQRLFVAKTAAHIMGMVVTTLVMYGVNFVIIGLQYGLGDLDRSIQSVLEYRSCGSIMSVGEFLIFGMTLILYLFSALTVVIDFICLWGKRTIFSILLLFFIGTADILLFLKIPINSALGCLKYINPAFCLNVGEVVGKYVNVNIFGNPVSYLIVVLVFYATVLGICFSFALVRFCQSPLEERRGITLARKLKRNCVPRYHMSLFRYELFKVRKGGHVFIVLFFFMILSVLISYQDRLIFEDEDEYYYYSYMERLSGERTAEKSSYIEEEEQRFQNIKKKQEELAREGKTDALIILGESMRPYQGFQRAREREEYLEENELVAFVYEGGYLKLADLKENTNNRMLVMLGMMLLTFALCGVFSLDRENGQQMLLQTTRFGKKYMFRKKLLVAALICLLSFVIVYFPQLYIFHRLYGFEGIREQIGCIQLKSWLGDGCPIWGWLLYQYSMRLLMMAVYGIVVLFVSYKLKSVFTTVTVMGLFLLLVYVIC